ncbi:MAG: S8 family serine peptidase, partial [Verrucomicrobia bacterium]|nr:S8 family serine peptidase [Verrucomicrobiota bacterium]
MATETPDSAIADRILQQITINAAVRKGAVVVAAAMNDQAMGSPFALPGMLPNVIAVGAVDANDHIAPFSNLR